MLSMEQENEKTFVLRLQGRIDSQTMEEGLKEVLEKTEGLEAGRLLYDIKDFEFPTMGAVMAKMLKLPQLFSLARRFEKVAVLTDTQWLRTAAQYGTAYPGIETRAFAHEEEEEARQWLES